MHLFDNHALIVTVGWSIYLLGYFFGYLLGIADDNILNLICNLADMLNKIWFVAAFCYAAKLSCMISSSVRVGRLRNASR